MSLDVAKLKNVRRMEGGILQARCPACAEGGHDRAGNHLRVYPDGRYGCCVHPKDGAHRKRIFALAGSLRTAAGKPGTFGVRLRHSAGTAGSRSVKAALGGGSSRTVRTVETESESGVPSVPSLSASLVDPNSGTLGTPIFNPYAYAREGSTNIDIGTHTCKDSAEAVPSVPKAEVALPLVVAGEKLPYLTPGGTLVIPFDSPERYHWWKGGQSVSETLVEVKRRMNHGDDV